MTEVPVTMNPDAMWLEDYAGEDEAEESGTEVPEYVRMRLEHDELASRAAHLAEVLVERKAEAMAELVESILGWCDNHGFARADLMIELNKAVPPVKVKAKPKSKAKAKVVQHVTLFADPACPGKIYKRGPYPAWMKDRMLALGMDPGDIDSRRKYKETHLHVVG